MIARWETNAPTNTPVTLTQPSLIKCINCHNRSLWCFIKLITTWFFVSYFLDIISVWYDVIEHLETWQHPQFGNKELSYRIYTTFQEVLPKMKLDGLMSVSSEASYLSSSSSHQEDLLMCSSCDSLVLSSESNWRCITTDSGSGSAHMVGVRFLCPHCSLTWLWWWGTTLDIEPALIHLWPADQKYSWKWQRRLTLIVYSLLMQERSMMTTDSNMTLRQSRCSSIKDQAATQRLVNKGSDTKKKKSKAVKASAMCCWTRYLYI